MILPSRQTHKVPSCSIVTIAVYFASLLCSANQACTECCLEVTAVKKKKLAAGDGAGGGGSGEKALMLLSWHAGGVNRLGGMGMLAHLLTPRCIPHLVVVGIVCALGSGPWQRHQWCPTLRLPVKL